jgi:hypothetical protein
VGAYLWLTDVARPLLAEGDRGGVAERLLLGPIEACGADCGPCQDRAASCA